MHKEEEISNIFLCSWVNPCSYQQKLQTSSEINEDLWVRIEAKRLEAIRKREQTRKEREVLQKERILEDSLRNDIQEIELDHQLDLEAAMAQWNI